MQSFSRAILDAIDVHVVVIDRQGALFFVNQAWKNFFTSNGGDIGFDWLGFNYIDVCKSAAKNGDSDSIKIVEGISEVVSARKPAFEYEYPCHSPEADRWFVLRVAPLPAEPEKFVVTHQNVTHNKLMETRATRLSIEDPLTSLYNRRGLDLRFAKEYRRALRYQTKISFVIIDIDNFKEFNDFFGHQLGDKCLLELSNIIRRYTRRTSDIAARIGGDEFVIIFPQMDTKKVLESVNAMIKDVSDLSFLDSGVYPVSISVGVATMIPNETEKDKDKLYRDADTALYQAKKNRNCVLVAEYNS